MNKTKIQQLREWLEAGQPVTQKIAIERWNYYRLSAGIYILRRQGMNISRLDVSNPSGDGTYGKYWLNK